MEIYKYLFWALFLLSFVTYFVQHLICAYYYKTQNLKRRYNAKWALVTGASSGARQLSPCSSDVLFEEFHDAFLSQVMCGTVCHHLFYAHCRDWQVHCLQIGTPGLERSAGSPGNSARCVLAHSCKSRTVVQMCEGVRSVKVQIQNRQKRGSSAACNLCIACLLASGRGKSQLGTAVPANLGGDDYLDSIKAATDDIPVQVRNLLVELVGAASYHIVFCNAGYLLTGFFFASLLKTWVMRVCCTSGQRFGTGAFQHAHYRPEFSLRSLGELMANMNCNATSAVQITHHFVSKMVRAGLGCCTEGCQKQHSRQECPHIPACVLEVRGQLQTIVAAKLKGCFVYTSSAAASAPSPFSVLYAATKSFLASFGAGLAAEQSCISRCANRRAQHGMAR
eukprot:1148859-Pelagomonas_calceolata.AAC.10